MAIMIPGWLQWLEWVAGSDWPEGNEDLQRELGIALTDIADELRDSAIPQAETAIRSLLVAYPEGEGKEQIQRELAKLLTGEGSIESLAKAFDQMGASAKDFAGQIRSNKLNGIFSLAWLAAELAYSIWFGPAAPLAQAGAIAACQTAFRWLGSRLLSVIGSIVGRMAISQTAKAIITKVVYEIVQEAFTEVIQGTLQEMAVQGLNVGQGYQDNMNWGQVGTNAWISAVAGGVGGGAGYGMHSLMNRTPLGDARWAGLFKGAVTGAGAGLAGAGAAYVSTGLSGGGWELDPRMLTGGALSGVGPSAVHGWRGSSNYAGGPMQNVRPGSNVGSMPTGGDGSTSVRPASADPSGVATDPTGGTTTNGATTSGGGVADTGAPAANGGRTTGTDVTGADADTSTPGQASQNAEPVGRTDHSAADSGSPSNQVGAQESGADAPAAAAAESSATGNGSTEIDARSGSEPAAVNHDPSVANQAPESDGHVDSSTQQVSRDGAVDTPTAVDTTSSQGSSNVADSSLSDDSTTSAASTDGATTNDAAPKTNSPDGSVAMPGTGPVGGMTAAAPAGGMIGAAPVGGTPSAATPAPPNVAPATATSGPAAGVSHVAPAASPGAVRPVQAPVAGESGSAAQAGPSSANQRAGAADPTSAGADRAGGLRADRADSEVPQRNRAGSETDADSDPGARTRDDAEANTDVGPQAEPENSALPAEGFVLPVAVGNAAVDAANRAPTPDRAARTANDGDAETGIPGAPDADSAVPDADAGPDADPKTGADPDAVRAAAERMRVLPENHVPPTVDETAAADAALRKLAEGRGGAALGDLLHGDPAATDVTARAADLARANAEWWNSLTAAERAGMIRTHPEVIGRTPGIDPTASDTANRLQMAREFRDLAGREDLTRAERKQLQNLRATIRGLRAAQVQAAAVDPDLPVHVLAYDSTAFGGKGRAVVAFGRVDTANHVSWHVAGKNHTVGELGSSLGAALGQYRSSVARVRTGESIASIAWVGYDAPARGLRAGKGFFLGRARAGARLLLQDLAAADAVRTVDGDRDTPTTNKVIALGYGVDVAEAAGKDGRLQGLAADVVLGGLPGDPYIRPGHFGSDVRVHVADASSGLFSRLEQPLPDRGEPPNGVPTNAMYRVEVLAADRAGTAAHRNQDTESPDTDRPALSENNCAEPALWRVKRQTGNDAIELFEPGSIGPEGVSWRQLQEAAGGELSPVAGNRTRSAHEMIADGLRYQGGRAAVLVVDESRAPVDEHGVGSHAYAMYFDPETGKVMVDDPLRADQPFEFDPAAASDAKATWGVFYGADGELLRPLAAGSGAETDEDPLRPGSRVGETDPAAPDIAAPGPVAGRPDVDDGPISDQENADAEAAVQALGRDPERLPHGNYRGDIAAQARARAEANADWWHHRIDEAQRAAMIRVHPELVGNADGIPAEARNRANLLSLERDLNSYRMRTPERLGMGQVFNPEFNSAEPDHLRNLIAINRALDRAYLLAAALDPGVPVPEVQLLSYEALRYGGQGRALVSFGNLDEAASVSWHVPDSGTSVRTIGDQLIAAAGHYEATARADVERSAASVVWLGAETPSRAHLPSARRTAARGAEVLIRDLAGFDATRAAAARRSDDPAPRHTNHLFGHRYGSSVIGYAGSNGRLADLAGTITLVGTHDAGPLRSATEFRIGDNVYVATSGRDRAAALATTPARLGRLVGLDTTVDPTTPRFRARPIAVDNRVNEREPLAQLYFHTDPDGRIASEAQRNFGLIAAGRGADVGVPARTDAAAVRQLITPDDGTRATGDPHRVPVLPADVRPDPADAASVAEAERGLRELLADPEHRSQELLRRLASAELANQQQVRLLMMLHRAVAPEDVVGAARDRATHNATWWHGLSDIQRSALVVRFPQVIGGADGIPAAVRDVANRLAMTRDLRRFLAMADGSNRPPLTPEQWTELRNIVAARRQLAALAQRAAASVGSPPVQLVSYDPRAFGGKGKIVVSLGDLDSASSVSWHVGGRRTTMQDLGDRMTFARGQHSVTSALNREIGVASIVWIGYDHPDTRSEAGNPRRAAVGGYLLARDIAAWNATRAHILPSAEPGPAHHLVGHGIGATTTGFAVAGGRLAGEIATVTLVGPAGAGPVRVAADIGIGAENVFVVAAPGDRVATPGPIGRFGQRRLGANPALAEFGARRVLAGYPDTREFGGRRGAHRGYLTYADPHTRTPTASLANIGLIAAGRGPEVAAADQEGPRPRSGARVVTAADVARVFEAVRAADTDSAVPVDAEPDRTGRRWTSERPLPTVAEVTDTDRGTARRALDALAAGARSTRLLHAADPADVTEAARQRTADNARWWRALDPGERRAVLLVHPHEVGNADGIPAHVRDFANRLSIARDLAAFAERAPDGANLEQWMRKELGGLERRRLENLVYTQRALVLAERKVGLLHPNVTRPPVHVIGYSATEFGGAGRALLSFGNIDTADSVSWQIPGVTTTLQHLKARMANSLNLFEVSSRMNPDLGFASVAWIGYDAPSGSTMAKETVSQEPAEQGGKLLARDMAAFNAGRDFYADKGGPGRTANHLFAHSYGSTTTGYAGAGGRLAGEVSTITLLGSPGAGPLRHASDFGIGAENVYVATGSRDPVTWVGANIPGEMGRFAGRGQGTDPSIAAFGARRLRAEFPRIPRFADSLRTHRQYWQYTEWAHRTPTEALENFGLIASGRAEEVSFGTYRPGLDTPTWLQRSIGSRPRDPEFTRVAAIQHGSTRYRRPDDPGPRRATDPRPGNHGPGDPAGAPRAPVDESSTATRTEGPTAQPNADEPTVRADSATEPVVAPQPVRPAVAESEAEGEQPPRVGEGDRGGRGPGDPPAPPTPSDPDDGNRGFRREGLLPVDRRPTSEELRAVADLLHRRAPDAGPDRLLHGDYAAPDTVASARDRASANAHWWDSLTPAQRMLVVRAHPHQLGNADGIPSVARDYANRLAMVRDLADLRATHSSESTRTDRTRLRNLETTLAALAEADRMAAEVGLSADLGAPPVHVLSYDALAFGGKGRAVLAFGDVDTADSVSWHVPGIKTNLGKLGWNAEFARNHYEVTARRNPDRTVASIAWLGYGAPTGYVGAFRTGPAEQGGALLARDIAAANASREARVPVGGPGRPVNHVFGHSYGSTTTSYAGGGGRLASEVSTIT
ncbi:alpha/beta hydrolase, partial [Nocardia aurea]|uniref:alpha/beta hydrolase n=1 Tax=Nocardia aurea TaxID=2144174 RepID=UPI0033A9D778